MASDVLAHESSPSILSNNLVVGSGWMLSSMFLTTYYTTTFLKFDGKKVKQDNGLRLFKSKLNSIEPIVTTSRKHRFRFQGLSRISRPQLLTLFRFGGSVLMGLLLHPDIPAVKDRALQTIYLAKDFSTPAFFGYLANYCNSIALSKIGISLTYTSKCGIPLVTVLFSLILDGLEAMPPVTALLSLIRKFKSTWIFRFHDQPVILLFHAFMN